MSLAPGTRLGPYEIVAPLGAGGMGEVYRAKDTRLGRDVAIKVLPQHLSAQPEVRAPFEREAKTIYSFNHPHICTLHDVGREGDTDFLVMELIEGETLAQRLARGALPLPEALRLGAQVADALDRAHRAGVIHRDLKPGNVMLAKTGSGPVNARLMDFGLARAVGLAGTSGSSLTAATMTALTQSPTVAQPLTAEGSLVGTYQYMAPEQLEGREADVRSDLWAFGCLLYEMATGKRAFEGKSQASLIAAILEREPTPLTALAPMTPPGLARAVRQCLAKEPDERWQTAADLRRELLWLQEGRASSSSASQVGPAPALPGRSSSRALPWLVGAALVGLAAGFGVASQLGPPAPTARLARFSIEPQGRLQFENSQPGNVAISPDGRLIVMATGDTTGTRRLWGRGAVDALEPRVLPGKEGAYNPFWSPDAASIGFFAEGKLKRTAVEGGRPQVLGDAKAGRGGAWSPEGVILFSANAQSPLLQVTASGGEPKAVTTLDAGQKQIAQRWPQILPDGRHFLYAALPAGRNGFSTFMGSLDGQAPRLVLRAEAAAVFAPPGHILFERNQTLFAQAFDPARGVTRGEPASLGELPNTSGNLAEPNASASRDGTLCFVRTVALARNDPEMQTDIWLADLERHTVTRFTSDPGIEWYYPTWSPDGRRLAFAANSSGTYDIVVRPVSGGGREEVLYHSDVLKKWPTSWVPDGRFIVFDGSSAETGDDIWLLPMEGDRKPVPFLQ